MRACGREGGRSHFFPSPKGRRSGRREGEGHGGEGREEEVGGKWGSIWTKLGIEESRWTKEERGGEDGRVERGEEGD